MSSLACIINSAALGPRADHTFSSGGKGLPYANRAWLLRNVLLPCYTQWFSGLFSEIVVVGEFEDGPGYTYVPCPSEHFSCVDALKQRQMGFEALKNKSVEWVLFQHDDHLYDPANVLPRPTAADVISPSRWTRARSQHGERLNNGESLGHISGHAAIFRPALLEWKGFRWDRVTPVFTWDHGATDILNLLGANIVFDEQVRVWDVEAGGTPWL